MFTEKFYKTRALKQISWEETKTNEILEKHRERVDKIITNRANPEEEDARISALREEGLVCKARIKSGINKGRCCSSPSINGTLFCGRHRNLNVVMEPEIPAPGVVEGGGDPPIVEIIIGEPAVDPADGERPRCQAITKKKTRCTNKISMTDIALGITNFCGKHKSLRR